VNAGLALALLALVQLFLTWATDRSLEPIDRPMFLDQARKRGADGLGICEFLTDTTADKGKARTQAVLRMVGLGAKARSVATALVVSVVGIVASIIIILARDREPEYRELRLLGLVVACIVAGIALILLLVKMADRSLVSFAPGESTYRRGKMTPRRSLGLLRIRFACPQVTTRYFAAALFGNAVTILASLKL
jgi:hypothetical protein